MARINLLPWRQAERERKNREFLILVASVLLLSLLAAFAAWSYFNDTLDSQKQANEKIKQENTNLDKALAEIDTLEKQRDEMISRMKVIQDLQGRRPIPVRVWDDIARLIPPQMYLINMKRDGDVITFKGKADNPDVVAAFIRSLDGSKWLENSAVKSIQQPQATAYLTTPTPAAPTTPSATGAGTTQPPRPTYPEDSYVSFEVTTNLSKAKDGASTTAGTTVSTSSAPIGTAISSVSQTTAINNTTVASTPTTAHVTNPAVATSQTVATPAMNPAVNSSNKVSGTTTTTATTTTVTKETK